MGELLRCAENGEGTSGSDCGSQAADNAWVGSQYVSSCVGGLAIMCGELLVECVEEHWLPCVGELPSVCRG